MAEGIIDEVADAVEDLFPHKPGGIIDRERQNRANREAADAERLNMSQRIEQVSAKAVKVAPQSPEVFASNTLTIAAGAFAQILPLGPYRYRATIMVITSSATAILAKDSSAALGGTGFSLPFGIPLTFFCRGQLYAQNPGVSAIQVSFIAELYAPEKIA